LHEDVKLYFDDAELLAGCAHTTVFEKAHGGIEKREYWQTGYFTKMVHAFTGNGPLFLKKRSTFHGVGPRESKHNNFEHISG